MFIPKKTWDLVNVRNLWTDLFDSSCPYIYYRLLWKTTPIDRKTGSDASLVNVKQTPF